MAPRARHFVLGRRQAAIADRLDASGCTTSRAAARLRTEGHRILRGGEARTFKNARLAAFGSTRRKDVSAAADDQVQLLIAAAAGRHDFRQDLAAPCREVLQTTLDENVAMIADTVAFLKQHGRFVVYDAEHCFDGFKEDTPYALATLRSAEEAGADIVTLCDTNGGSLPADIAAVTVSCAARCRPGSASTPTTTSGSASPTRLAAIEAGDARAGTINGYGERNGNCT